MDVVIGVGGIILVIPIVLASIMQIDMVGSVVNVYTYIILDMVITAIWSKPLHVLLFCLNRENFWH